MLSKDVLKAIFICLGLTTIFCWMWLMWLEVLSTDHVPRFLKHGPRVQKDTNNFTFVIMDYTGYIKHVEVNYLVGKCLITKNHELVEEADAIVINSRKLSSKNALPKSRKPWQRWVWLLDENPLHSLVGRPFSLADFKNVYNWTMTYRTNADVHIPYGWTKHKTKPGEIDQSLWNRRKLVAAVISNCNPRFVHNSRMEYVKLLNKTIPITLYGKCGTICAGFSADRLHKPCLELANYLFYLAFENSNCKEYITEKLFLNGFESGSVPVVLGASKEDYNKIAPPNSFIRIGDFKTSQELGKYLKYLANNRTAYMQFHEWRKDYTTLNRIQFISTTVWKPLCDKLTNSIGVQNVISDLEDVWKLSDCDDNFFW